MEEKEEANLPSAPSSSSNSDIEARPNSRPHLLRQLQAALKRNRPIGTMQSSNIRPRRILLPQREPSRISASEQTKNATATSSSLTPPLTTETSTALHTANMDPNVPSSQPLSAADCQKKVQFSLADHSFCQQSEYDVNHLVEMPPINDHQNQQRDTQQMQMFDMGMSDGGISSLLAKRSMLMQNPFLGKEISQPMNQSSVVASSCMTTISVHSKSAPALNSTTYNSRPCQDVSSHMDIEPIEEHKVDPQPISQAYPQQLSYPTYQCTSGMLVDSSAAPTQMSVSSLVSTVEPKDHGKQGFVSKDSDMLVAGLGDHAKGSSALQDQSNREKGHPGDVTDVQSQAPMTKSSCTSIKPEPSKSDKHEKAASSKGAAGSRKKNHDSDVFVKVNGKLYQKLGKIGSGGSSEVYKVISSDCTIYALKRIKLKGRDYSTAYGFCQEVEYLNKLKGKNNIIQLIDYEVTDKTLLEEVMNGSMNIKDGRIRDDGYIYMVLEYGEIDLAHMLSQKWKEQDSSSWTMDENWLRFYWQQILQAVNTIHEERIVHSDLKPANFLLVKGALKLIDFGIAKAIMSDTTNIQRDSQVGTLSYMSPEAFMCNENDSNGNAIKCGRPSDIWSLGCILYQMVYGRTPFSEYKTFWAKFKVITDKNHKINYEPVSNPWLLDLMKKCLAWERNDRWRIPQLLQHPFLVPPVTPSPQNERFELFEQIVETCGNDDEEVSRLCSELQLLIRGSNGGARSQHSILRDLSHISSLWSRLQQHLKNVEEA